jgi:hypothetical protein
MRSEKIGNLQPAPAVSAANGYGPRNGFRIAMGVNPTDKSIRSDEKRDIWEGGGDSAPVEDRRDSPLLGIKRFPDHCRVPSSTPYHHGPSAHPSIRSTDWIVIETLMTPSPSRSW